MKIELTYVELSKIERALNEKIERVNDIISECDHPDLAKELLTYFHNLNSLHEKVEKALFWGCHGIQ